MAPSCRWVFHSRGTEVGLVLEGLHGMKIRYALKFGFQANNKEAKYEVVIVGLRIANDIGAKRRQFFLSDSMLIVQ